MEEAAAAELPPQATPPKTPDAMPGSNGPPAVPPEVQAIIAQDSLSRQGTPSRERKELWELLNLPEGESFSGGWHKLLEATRSSKVIRSAMDQNRANDDILMEMVQTCLESIAENTFFVSTAKKTFAAHEKMLEEIPNLRADMVRRAPVWEALAPRPVLTRLGCFFAGGAADALRRVRGRVGVRHQPAHGCRGGRRGR